jgi:hypothetical protein
MNEGIKSQIAALLGLLLLATIAVAPWEAETHWLEPQKARWNAVIAHKNDLLIQQHNLRNEIDSFQYIPEKTAANQQFRKNMGSTTPDDIQGFITSSPKYQIFGFKATQIPETRELRISLVAKYNPLGQMLTDLWNNYEFMEITTMIVKPNPARPDDEVSATIGIRLPQ